MKKDIEDISPQHGATFRDEANWLRFQADLMEDIAARADNAASLERDFQLQAAKDFPDFAEQPSLASDGEQVQEIEPKASVGSVDDVFADDIGSFISIAGEGFPVQEPPADMPEGLTGLQGAFKKDWLKATEPISVLGEDTSPTVFDFSDNGPETVPLSGAPLRASARPDRAPTFYITPDKARGISGKSIMSEPEHLGHFSRLGNIRGESGRGLYAVAMHALFPRFMRTLAEPFTGRLFLWVDLECETAKTSSFLAPKPGVKRPLHAMVRAWSTLAFSGSVPSPDSPPNRGVVNGRVTLWDTNSEWYSFMKDPTADLKDHIHVARDNWLRIDTGIRLTLTFGVPTASPFSFYVGLYDAILASDSPGMVTYMHMRNLYRLKRVVFELVP